MPATASESWLGATREQMNNAFNQAPGMQEVAARMGFNEMPQWAKNTSFTLHSKAWEQAREMVKVKVMAEYGPEVIDMVNALSECTNKISEELKLSEANFGITMALPLVAMQHNQLDRPDVEGLLMDSYVLDQAAHWIKFAAAAYGTTDIKAYDKASVHVAMGEDPNVTVLMALLPAKGVNLPGHFVAVDRAQKAVILGVRGTTTLSDALTDAVGEATTVPECPGLLAHKAMLASARAVLEKTKPTILKALEENRGFSLLVTGHSLGAGTAILCTLLLSEMPLPPKPRLRCYAFAPPPVVGPVEHRSLKQAEIHSFINRADVVPRASLANVFSLGQECMAVDGLDLDFFSRFNLMRRDAAPENEAEKQAKQTIVAKVKECQDARKGKPHQSFPPLFVAGQVYWIEWLGQAGSVQDDDTESARAPRIHRVSPYEFQSLLLRGGTNALKDHLCDGYKEGIEGYRVHMQAMGGCSTCELKLDYVDLLIADCPPEQVPSAWPFLEEALRENRCRFLGVSNFDLLGPKVSVEVFRQFLAATKTPPAVMAMEVHPLNTNEEMCECCRSMGIQVLAYSPLGAPHKVESFMKVLAKSDARDMRPLVKVAELPLLQTLARRHEVSPAQVALRWNLQRGHSVVPKSWNPSHICENVQLFNFNLTTEDCDSLAEVRAERFFQASFSTASKARERWMKTEVNAGSVAETPMPAQPRSPQQRERRSS
ncbi:unnamed protein product [Effrenium voratum]|nr:unnamed protein product [Effrenium voratum]